MSISFREQPIEALTQQITRVSVAPDGTSGNGLSGQPSISADGRYVAFYSSANNLVLNDTNGFTDVFVHDRSTGETQLISVNSNGELGNGDSDYPSISADGRYVAFESGASNLVANDTNSREDIFVHDRTTSETILVSVASDGTQANWHAYHPSISSDGRYVAFDSFADNLVPGDTNMDYGGMTDVFVHDRSTSETTRVSVDSNGTPGNENSDYPGISADGRYVAFHSTANNYVPNDTTNSSDIFVHDRVTDETTIVSISSSGEYGNFQSMYPSVSADGRYVAFESLATNLVPNQTTNPFLDVYVHDRNTGNTAIASVTSDGTSGNSDSNRPKISPDGRYVAFGSNASNLVSDDTNGEPDAFVYDRITEETIILSRTNDGAEANSGSGTVCLSNEGRYAAFISDASNLVPDDDNGRIDVFVYDRDWMLSTSQLIYLPFIVKP